MRIPIYGGSDGFWSSTEMPDLDGGRWRADLVFFGLGFLGYCNLSPRDGLGKAYEAAMNWLAAQQWWLPPIVAIDLIPNLFGGKFGAEWLRTKPTFIFFPSIFLLTIWCHCPNTHPYHRKSSLPPLRRCYRHGATKELGLRHAWTFIKTLVFIPA
jgi:hypothetical protein